MTLKSNNEKCLVQPGPLDSFFSLEPKRPAVFEALFPQKQGLNSNQNKGPHLGSRYIYIVFLVAKGFLVTN